MDYKEVDHAVNIKDIVGTYVLTAHSKKMMHYEGKYNNIPDSKIRLRTDSTYLISDAPDWLGGTWGTSYGSYYTKSGKWSFSCDDKYGCVLELEGIETGNLLGIKNNKLNILLPIGDGDNCLGLVYEKQ